jgi:hypothetical protein
MIALLPDDFGNTQQFPYAWRWTDARWNVLPPEKLAKVRPLVETKAREVCERGFQCLDRSMLRREFFAEIVAFNDSKSSDPGRARAWLAAQPVEGDTAIFVCWGDALAVQTRWSVFCEFWDDFCYPMEAVLIWPASEQWALLYHPEERLYFGKRAA